MTRIGAGRGYDLLRHVVAQVSNDDLAWADDVLVMDDENYRQLVGRLPTRPGRVRLLDPGGIPDPWLVDDDPAYSDSLDRIERAVRPTWGSSTGRPPWPCSTGGRRARRPPGWPG